jgi:hypothetical protein
MKKIVLFFSLVLATGIVTAQSLQAQQATAETLLEVYYTHSTNRCAGCKAIEKQTMETLNSDFKSEIESGKIKFTAVNIDEPANKKFVEEYEVWGSSLFIKISGSDKTIDLTRDGFAFARTKPEKFRAKLASTLRDNM